MKAVHFDAKTWNEIPAHTVSGLGGLAGFISWHRLAQTFRETQEIKPNEELLSFQIDERGITFRVSCR